MARRTILGPALLWLVLTPLWAADSAQITGLLNQYYAAIAEQRHELARERLYQVLKLEPEHELAWRGLGYSYEATGEDLKAAEAFQQANMWMAAGYAFQRAGAGALAHQAFLRQARRLESQSHDDACMAAVHTAFFRRQPLPDPWYLSAHHASTWQHRFQDAFFQTQLRAGRRLQSLPGASIYGLIDHSEDLKSETGGDAPQIFSDNYIGAGVGVDWRRGGLRLFAETAFNHDTLDRQRDADGFDHSLGAAWYGRWGADERCPLAPTWQRRAFADLYSAAVYRSRLSNLFAQISGRAGYQLFEWRQTQLSAYGRINLLLDSEREPADNYLELGPGLAWKPWLSWPVELRTEYLLGRYLQERVNGGRDYQGFFAQLIVGFSL
ncbi:MAG: hypothetical protein ACPGZP_03425 [Panacagrimonas sp.]